ncbi:MAG: hypothetical protein AB7G39_15525, partial [Alphaproteobacteria bacterium]
MYWAFLDRPSPIQPQPVSFVAAMNAKMYGPIQAPVYGSNTQSEGWSEAEQGAVGCIVGGTVGTTASLYIGAANIINLIAGGGAPPASPAARYAAVAGVVYATFCAGG